MTQRAQFDPIVSPFIASQAGGWSSCRPCRVVRRWGWCFVLGRKEQEDAVGLDVGKLQLKAGKGDCR